MPVSGTVNNDWNGRCAPVLRSVETSLTAGNDEFAFAWTPGKTAAANASPDVEL